MANPITSSLPDEISFEEASAARLTSISKTRRLTRMRLRLHGYSKSQAARLVGTLGDGSLWAKIQAAWVKYGPTIMAILKVVLSLLPFLMAQEPPEGEPVTGDDVPRALLDEEDEVLEMLTREDGDQIKSQT